MAEHSDVVVIGGGYAGVMAANRLTQRGDVTVTLINPRPVFVHRVRLHQLVGGTDSAVVDYQEVLAEGVRLVVDSVTRIDAAGRGVELASGGALGYDYLVYAVGSGSADPRVPGAAEFAYPIAALEEMQRLLPVLDAAPASAAVTVVGAVPTGIETAAELAEQGRGVSLVCGGVLGPYLHRRGRRSVAGRLATLGVTVVEGPDALVTAVTRDAVRLADGRELQSAVTVWTAGFGVSDLASVGPAAADELPGGDAAGCAGRRHGAQPVGGGAARDPQPIVRRAVHQPGPGHRRLPVRQQVRRRCVVPHRRSPRREDEGDGVPGHPETPGR